MRHKRYRRKRRNRHLSPEMREHFRKAVCGIDLRAAEKRRFPRIPRRNDETGIAVPFCGNENGQQSRNGTQFAAESKLSQKHGFCQIHADELFARLQKADCHRKIEGGALFLYVGRRKIDSDLVHREEQTAVLECGTHPLLRLLDRRIGKPHHFISRYALTDIRFHFNRNTFQPLERITSHFRDHISSPPIRSLFSDPTVSLQSPSAVRLRQEVPS